MFGGDFSFYSIGGIGIFTAVKWTEYSNNTMEDRAHGDFGIYCKYEYGCRNCEDVHYQSSIQGNSRNRVAIGGCTVHCITQ